MYGDDDAGNATEAFLAIGKMTDVSNGSEDSSLDMYTYAAGAQKTTLSLKEGKVGIGTTSPDRLLDVSGTGNVYGKFQSTNATGAGIEVQDSGENWLIQADDGISSGGLAFYDKGRTAYRMILDDEGQLGIGTTSPANLLHLNIAGSNDIGLSISNGQYDYTWGIDTSDSAQFKLSRHTGLGNYDLIKFHPTTYEIDLVGPIKSSGTGGHVQIDNGVGVTVRETMAATGHAWQANTYNVLSAGAVSIGSDSSNSSHMWWNTYDTGSKYNVSTGYGMDMYHAKSTGDFVIRMGSTNAASNGAAQLLTDAFRINKDGNVGIGQTSPAAKIHIGQSVTNEPALYAYSNTSNTAPLVKLKQDGAGSNSAAPVLSIENDGSGSPLKVQSTHGGGTVFEVNYLGRVGIGATDPQSHLHTHTASSNGAYHQFTNSSTGAAGADGWKIGVHDDENFIIWGQESTESFRIYNNGAYRFTVDHNGHVGIPATAKFYLDGISDTYIEEYSANEFGITTGGSRKFALSGGNLYHTGSLNSNHNFSDERLKENIVVIPNALEKVSSLRGITFTRKDDGTVGTGLIAQELEKVLPEAVYESKTIDSLEDPDAEEYKAINYGNTVGLLVEAIKELEARLTAGGL